MTQNNDVKKSFGKIGISTRIVDAKGYEEKRDALSQDWTRFLDTIKMIPVMIPNNLSNVSLFLESLNIDGIILSGGDDIGDNIDRDCTEREIIEFGIGHKLPIFGVCRGMQVLNKFFGGKIRRGNNDEHIRKKHQVLILNKPISELLKQNKIIVNSYHRNIINIEDVGESLISFAIHKKDNTIEGFIHKSLPIMGVMWHPERERNTSLLKKFLENKLQVK